MTSLARETCLGAESRLSRTVAPQELRGEFGSPAGALNDQPRARREARAMPVFWRLFDSIALSSFSSCFLLSNPSKSWTMCWMQYPCARLNATRSRRVQRASRAEFGWVLSGVPPTPTDCETIASGTSEHGATRINGDRTVLLLVGAGRETFVGIGSLAQRVY